MGPFRAFPSPAMHVDQTVWVGLEVEEHEGEVTWYAPIAIAPGVDPATLSEIQRYAKLFWINNGPYNNLTARKFVLQTTPQALAAAAKAAASAGAQFSTASGESLEAMRVRLQPMFFDANVDPIVTNKTPGPGKDILTASANNLYTGVSMADLKGFTEKNGLNSRLVKRNGRL